MPRDSLHHFSYEKYANLKLPTPLLLPLGGCLAEWLFYLLLLQLLWSSAFQSTVAPPSMLFFWGGGSIWPRGDFIWLLLQQMWSNAFPTTVTTPSMHQTIFVTQVPDPYRSALSATLVCSSLQGGQAKMGKKWLSTLKRSKTHNFFVILNWNFDCELTNALVLS